MFPTIDEPQKAIPETEVPYSFFLGMKELSVLALILFFGFSGFTLCVDKIYAAPQNSNEPSDIQIHKKEVSEDYISYNLK